MRGHIDRRSAGETATADEPHSTKTEPEHPEIHGFHLSPEEHRMLRGAPPPEALRWAAEAIGPGSRIRSVRALPGGMSSAIHALGIEDRDGRLQRAILRRFVRADWLAEEPDLAEREAAALELLRDSPVPAPRLIAVDPCGERAGVPAVLMTRLSGRIEWHPRDLDAFLRSLAAPLPAIHATAVPAGSIIPTYRPYELEMRRPPRWAAQPEVWHRAFEVHAGPPPTLEHLFIHRDYHPGNVLWARGKMQGVIDWVNASRGSPEADVGHCRMNLAYRFGQPAADRFLRLYQALSERREYHPYWDIVAAIGGLDESDDARANPRGEAFLARAVAELSG